MHTSDAYALAGLFEAAERAALALFAQGDQTPHPYERLGVARGDAANTDGVNTGGADTDLTGPRAWVLIQMPKPSTAHGKLAAAVLRQEAENVLLATFDPLLVRLTALCPVLSGPYGSCALHWIRRRDAPQAPPRIMLRANGTWVQGAASHDSVPTITLGGLLIFAERIVHMREPKGVFPHIVPGCLVAAEDRVEARFLANAANPSIPLHDSQPA